MQRKPKAKKQAKVKAKKKENEKGGKKGKEGKKNQAGTGCKGGFPFDFHKSKVVLGVLEL